MAMTLVDFDTPLNALRAEIAQAKQNNTYAADVSDKKIVKTLADLLKAALAITDGYFKKVVEHHAAAKKAIDAMEALIRSKGKKLSDKDIDVLETSARFIRIAKEQLSMASREAFPPLEQFRRDWPGAYKGLLSKPVLVEPLVAGRTKSIEDGKKVDTLKQRVEQYFARAVDLVKVAKQAVSKESVLAGHEAKAIQDFKSGAGQCKMNYDEFAQKARNSLEQIAASNPRTKLDGNLLKMNDARLLNGQAEAKNARGALKTLTLKVDTFKQLTAKLEGANKRDADTQLSAAQRALKEAEKDASALAALQSKAEKNLAAIKKL